MKMDYYRDFNLNKLFVYGLYIAVTLNSQHAIILI